MRIDYPPSQPHGEILRILPDVYTVSGSVRLAPATVINRNMTIVRSGDDLTLINPVRLRPVVEERLLDIGNIRHLVRLGYYHGCDDLYYRDRFNATFWRQAGSDYYPPPADRPLCEGDDCPVPGGRFLELCRGQRPEAVMWLPHSGGLLLACDALQYWRTWSGCSWCGRSLLRLNGLRRGVQVVPGWCAKVLPKGRDPSHWMEEDFRRLLQWRFNHFLGGHGEFLADAAGEQVAAAVERVFPDLQRAA